jgi:hypothetical protein
MGHICLKDFPSLVVLLLQKFARLLAVFVLSLSASAGYAAYRPAFTEVLDFTHYHVNADSRDAVDVIRVVTRHIWL